jgi:sulfatase modifying factor 1
MRLLPSLYAGLALALIACGGSDVPPVPPSPPAPTPSGAPTAAVAPTAVTSAVPTTTAAFAATTAPEPAAPASPCPPNMALVQGGTYTMARPKREVTTGAICMDLNETTADEYAACVKSGKCSGQSLKCAAQATYETAGKGNHPINCVDFAQAITYCGAQGKRLASDEEWEWVARGGAAGHAYPWGDDKPNGKACWSGESALVSTCAVGATPAGDSPQGIHDLAGNVFEWTTSRNDKSGTFRIGRGGSWRDSAPDGLKASRSGPGFEVQYRCGFLGIRCVTEPAKH